jgi:hypothetical protein
MMRCALLAALACAACLHSARAAAVAELDAAALLTSLVNASVAVTFYTRWRVPRPHWRTSRS